MIIHICGASGSGKTTLGKKLKTKLKTKIIVKDMDVLLDEYFRLCSDSGMSHAKFAKQFAKGYQKFVSDFIARQTKPLIITGLNCFIQGETYRYKVGEIAHKGTYPKITIELGQNHSFYIDLDTEIIIKQQYYRGYDDFILGFYQYMKRDKDEIFNSILENEAKAKKDICEYITDIMNFSRIRVEITKWNKFYAKLGYEFIDRDKIYKEVIKLTDKK